jgi:DeoR/GlpR family transcriptional regulator of sugar metabolism
MFAAERQARIVEEVRRSGSKRVSELSLLFGVSDMTVRRDLERLAEQGLVDKVHGGATVPRRSSAEEPGFEAKWEREGDEKDAIAAAAAAYALPGCAVGLSAGTTTWRLAHYLRDVPSLTIVTNSLQIAQVLYTADPQTGSSVILTGGSHTPSDALVGPIAVAALRSLHLDLLFLGVHGMDPMAGFSTPNLLEAEVNRAFVTTARRTIVVADHTKWLETGLATTAPLSAADVLITDDGLGAEAARELREQVGELVLVPVRDRAGVRAVDGAAGHAEG